MMKMNPDIATHDSPMWREKADFLIFADLTAAGMPGRWEQLWAREVGETAFEICCIPFFTYGLALGNIVRTHSSGGRRHVVKYTEKSSGRRVLRLWLKNATQQGREAVLRYLASASPGHEWSSGNLLAIDVGPEGLDAACVALLAETSRFHIDVEWGD